MDDTATCPSSVAAAAGVSGIAPARLSISAFLRNKSADSFLDKRSADSVTSSIKKPRWIVLPSRAFSASKRSLFEIDSSASFSGYARYFSAS